MKRILLGAAAASLGLAFGCAASAATFVFDVSVTTRLDGAGPFSPFTFQQAWDIASSPLTSSVHGAPDHTYYRQYDFGSATAGYSPLTAPIMAFVDLSGPHSYSYNAFKQFDEYSSSPATATYHINLYDEVRTSVDLGGGKFLEKYYLRETNGSGPIPFSDQDILDEAGVAKLLSETGPLNWIEWGNASIHDTIAGTYQTVAQVDYFGTAQFSHLAGQVPEPMTWTMMICGFGMTGARLRRRTPRAA